MYSMNYIGKFIANFRDFYNEINGATLTGAIDVVVVEQPDGSFTCSPFHVRFGKLGVLRSRFKVVDLELNGEPLNIHMKLGESGEAFFVEEVGEDEAECAAHLATSPIPASRFDDLYEPRRRNSLSVVEPDHSQASDYIKRRYTADGQTMQKPDLSKLTKKDSAKDDKKSDDVHDQDALFEMDGLDDVQDDWTDNRAPRTFAATEVYTAGSEAIQTLQKLSSHDFRPIDVAPATADENKNGNGKKKKKTRKVGSKKKHQRKSSSSSISSQSDRAGSEQRTPQPGTLPNQSDLHFFSDTEVTTAIISEEMSNLRLTGDNRIPMALSDTAFELHAASRHSRGGGSRSGTPVQSDTEVELARAAAVADKSSQSWRWGELPEPPVRSVALSESLPSSALSPASPAPPPSPTEPLSSDEERGTSRRGVLSGMFRFMSAREANEATTGGVYLADLDRGQVDPDLYFPKHHAEQYRAGVSGGGGQSQTGPTEEEYESGNGPSLPQSPASPTQLHSPSSLASDDDDKILAKGQVGLFVREDSASVGGGSVLRAVEYDEWCGRCGDLASDDRLEVRVGERTLPWRSAAPLLISMLAYRRPLPNRVLDSLAKGCDKEGVPGPGSRVTDGATAKSRGYLWWGWRRSNTDPKSIETAKESGAPQIVNALAQSEIAASNANIKDVVCHVEIKSMENELVKHEAEAATAAETAPDRSSVDVRDSLEANENYDVDEEASKDALVDFDDINTNRNMQEERQDNSSSESEDAQIRTRPTRRHSTFRKTLRLSSDQIKKLNLRDGMNEMVFSVTTAYQGTTRCKCNVFRWRHDDKIVISDIDGTITKSDVLGHIFPMVGKDWAQSGVAQLFTKISNNGYKLLYLSARAIGQAGVTREYLRSIRQGELCLPDGPLLLNPTSLLRAFHREVIEKKPEEFKIQCLADIKALFPAGSNPFYAGYGNRINDVCAYQAVGIPIVRIFTINYKGELKHELTQTFQSTYSHMSVLVDQVFPPALCEPTDEFSQTVYWREPLLLLTEMPPVALPLARAN